MTKTACDLNQLQRRIQHLIVRPDEPNSNGGADNGGNCVDAEEIGNIFVASSRLAAADRLAIYRHSYFKRLMNCMRELYPVLRRSIGDDSFDLFASDYLQRYPSESYSLSGVDDNFTRYLTETRPVADIPPGAREQWPNLIIDLARLEQVFNDVYNRQGMEGERCLDVDRLLSLPFARWKNTRFVPSPCLKLMKFSFPVSRFFIDVRRTGDVEIPEPSETFVALTRSDYVVRFHDLTKTQFQLLEAIVDGEQLDNAIEKLSSTNAVDYSDLVKNARTWLRHWAESAFFRSQ